MMPGHAQLALPMWLGSPVVDLSPVSHACDVFSKRALSSIFEKQSRMAWVLYLAWGVTSLTNNLNGVLLCLVGFSLVGLWVLWGASSTQVADVLLLPLLAQNTWENSLHKKGFILAHSFGGIWYVTSLKSWWQDCLETGHITPSVCKQITASAGVQLAFSFSSGVSPSSMNSFWKYLMGTTASCAISNSSHVGHGDSSSHATLKVIEDLKHG